MYFAPLGSDYWFCVYEFRCTSIRRLVSIRFILIHDPSCWGGKLQCSPPEVLSTQQTKCFVAPLDAVAMKHMPARQFNNRLITSTYNVSSLHTHKLASYHSNFRIAAQADAARILLFAWLDWCTCTPPLCSRFCQSADKVACHHCRSLLDKAPVIELDCAAITPRAAYYSCPPQFDYTAAATPDRTQV